MVRFCRSMVTSHCRTCSNLRKETSTQDKRYSRGYRGRRTSPRLAPHRTRLQQTRAKLETQRTVRRNLRVRRLSIKGRRQPSESTVSRGVFEPNQTLASLRVRSQNSLQKLHQLGQGNKTAKQTRSQSGRGQIACLQKGKLSHGYLYFSATRRCPHLGIPDHAPACAQ